MVVGNRQVENYPSLFPHPLHLPPESTKVMWFLLWSVALDTCSSDYTCVSVCQQCGGETQGESTGTGWGGAGSQGQSLFNPR